jgi:hypothetical protein
MMMKRQCLLSIGLFGILACGGSEPDPRCLAVCEIREPAVEGAFDICSQSSASACVDQCAARIEGVESVCGTCLLEQAYFGTGPDDGPNGMCENGSCTMYGDDPGESCTFDEGDQAAIEDCYRQLFPRREVDCSPSFQPVSGCSGVCG